MEIQFASNTNDCRQLSRDAFFAKNQIPFHLLSAERVRMMSWNHRAQQGKSSSYELIAKPLSKGFWRSLQGTHFGECMRKPLGSKVFRFLRMASSHGVTVDMETPTVFLEEVSLCIQKAHTLKATTRFINIYEHIPVLGLEFRQVK